MSIDKTVSDKIVILNEFTMKYEVAVQAFTADNYLNEFYDFYEIKSTNQALIPSPFPFDESLKELGGDDVWQPIYEKTVSLFGEPEAVKVFDDYKKLIDELEGPDGLAPFFFVFDIMFCEYESFTLCFISGTNN